MTTTAEMHVERLKAQVAQMRINIRALLDHVGDLARCKGCGVEIWWIKTRAGRRAPYTQDGLNHFADCPQAERFRRTR